jgi:transcriptional antiterminator
MLKFLNRYVSSVFKQNFMAGYYWISNAVYNQFLQWEVIRKLKNKCREYHVQVEQELLAEALWTLLAFSSNTNKKYTSQENITMIKFDLLAMGHKTGYY